MNMIILKGRLTADPELKQTTSGVSVVEFTLAVPRRFDKDKTDFLRCIAWRQTAEFISQHFVKGSQILVTGAMQNEQWTDKNGNKRDSWTVNIDTVEFTERKEDSKPQTTTYTPVNKASDDFVNVTDDVDFPF